MLLFAYGDVCGLGCGLFGLVVCVFVWLFGCLWFCLFLCIAGGGFDAFGYGYVAGRGGCLV